MIDVNLKTIQIPKLLMDAVDAKCVERYGNEGFRKHLGASLVGNPCDRLLWLTFRWCFTSSFSGRMYRLFQRGHREEDIIIDHLRSIGCTVINQNEFGKQFNVSFCEGHFGGSCDGFVQLPKEWGIDGWILLECKTKKDGGGFTNLQRKGMILSEPVHYAQINTYGYGFNLKYALYVTVNKNTDEIYYELVPISQEKGYEQIVRASQIIQSEEAPPRMAEDATFYGCKSCNAYNVCYGKEELPKNCRSCKFAKATKNKGWFCQTRLHVLKCKYERYNGEHVDIEEGCSEWQPIYKVE